jgi:hypothetical protein
LLRIDYQHSRYQQWLLQALGRLAETLSVVKRIAGYAQVILLLWVADLSCVAPVLALAYTGRGRPPRDPLAMFRAWLAATVLAIDSPEQLAQALRTDEVLAVLCGFEPADTPGASTLRDFLRRLGRSLRRRQRRHRPYRKRGKAKKGQKIPLRHPDVLWRLLPQLDRFSRGDEGLLQQLLVAIAHASAQRGLIDPNDLRVAGDSILLPSHTSPYGHRTCDCPKDKPCTCPRPFGDPDATWGWDSHRNSWIWGHRFYEITAAGRRHDLPLYLRSVDANRHDAVSWLLSYAEARRFYDGWRWTQAILDSAHDAGAIFATLRRDGVIAVIDINPAHNPKRPVTLGPDGIPLCPAGHPMASDGSANGRTKFVCPAQRKRRGIDCPQPCRAHTVYLSGLEAFRTRPGIARDSEAWRLAYNQRTACERSHSRKVNDFHQKACRARGRPFRTARYFFAAFCQHFAAWRHEADLTLSEVLPFLRPWLPALPGLLQLA